MRHQGERRGTGDDQARRKGCCNNLPCHG
jgi:hypothetical protein